MTGKITTNTSNLSRLPQSAHSFHDIINLNVFCGTKFFADLLCQTFYTLIVCPKYQGILHFLTRCLPSQQVMVINIVLM